MEVGDVVALFDGVETELVGCSVGEAGLGAAARDQGGEAVRVMVATGAGDVLVVFAKLGSRGSAKLGAEDNHGVVEEAALLEIGNQGADGLIHLLGSR